MSDRRELLVDAAPADLRSHIPAEKRAEEVVALLDVLQTVRTERPPRQVRIVAPFT